MYFKKLELLGFKSFAEKTTFHFEPGITAIVGPNGCGKSNIFDGIRWVLGEQSEKALRSSKMEDVIFSGTQDSPGLGFAEVSLTFSNEKKFLPIEYSEVTVTRRLFRDGESQYLINKTPARLKDILDLFYGTGIGAESYSLVEQGKVDLILSSRPEDRRLIFEEAAGITKYKSDKKETLRKLEDTQNNLLRINDIISEVRRQINSLERQKLKAEKYKELFEKLKELEVRKASDEIQKLRDEKEIVNKDILYLENQINSIEDKIKIDSSGLLEINKESESQESEINSLREEIINSENKILNNKSLVSLNQERIKEMNSRILFLEEDKKSISERISEIKDSIEKKKEFLENIDLNLKEKKEQLRDKEGNLHEIEESVKKAQKEILEFKKILFEKSIEITNLKNQSNEVKIGLQNLLARKKRLEVEAEKIISEILLPQERMDSILKDLDSINKRLFALYDLDENDKRALEILESELICLDKKIKDLEKDKLAYISQKEFLKELNLKYEEIPLKKEAVFLLKEKAESEIFIAKTHHVEEIEEEIKKIFSGFNFKINCQVKSIFQDESILEERIKKIEDNIRNLEKEKEEKERNSLNLIEKRKDTQDNIRKLEIDKVSKENLKSQIEEEIKKLKDEAGLIDLEKSQNKKDLENLRKKESELEEEIKYKEREIQNLEKNIEENQNLISQKNQEREEITINFTKLKAEIDSLEDKIFTEKETLKILEDTHLRDLNDLEKREREKKEFLEKIFELQEKSKSLNSEIDQLEVKKENYRKDLESKQKENLRLKEVLKEKEIQIQKKNKEKEDLRNRINQFNLKMQEIEFSEKSIRERIQQLYKTEIEEIREEKGLESISLEIENLRKRLDSFGEVSLGAISEYNELKGRHDFLIQQRDDLISAKNSLETAIKKINHITKKMFLDTFKNVSLEFKDYFKQLFGGGDAQLFLIDESDPLESGIEIVCRPPGKRLQNIILLSGGEKALAAIALLFAIFKVKPSAFCVLDEVDAALDEANISRFSHLLKEFSQKSQFIVITHNKRTIANCDVMYGITMEKSGISKVVSVKFAKEKAKELVESQ